jgi:hypothetical protein
LQASRAIAAPTAINLFRNSTRPLRKVTFSALSPDSEYPRAGPAGD